ncbi:hypothetical protein DLAC_01100 [Tieghemostelium lacteum]|uniref:Major facilitator superfamily (MFS) profile domain-containing protein n=1 Tax=Tieghemostelium lacteum TaxID=361077 RepID=A0A152A7Q9_TIELA|nr:hypothetical protein DLAC_01100 [Tieghemostelium lacteum]|eukprot:KYR02270.1 hypothetical protein DLAC_01100 [Tieghemostelium lacteum]
MMEINNSDKDGYKNIVIEDSGASQPKKQFESTSQMVKFIFWLFCVCCSLAGVQFVYSTQYALGTPLFVNKFKMSPSTVTFIQSTAGPIAGFIIQPIVGVYSDACKSSFGRRRPFILTGAIMAIVSLLLIAFSPELGELMGDNDDGLYASDHKAGIAVAVTGFWIINFAVNVIMGPTRSLISDIVESDKQHFGNSMAVNTMGLASVIACVLGAQLATLANPYRNLFVIAAAFVGASVLPTLIAGKEKQLPADHPSVTSPIQVFTKIGYAFKTMPRDLGLISIVFFISWFGYSPNMVSTTTYFATNVEPNDQVAGIKYGFYAIAAFSAVSFLFSFFSPKLIHLLGARFVYSITQAIAGVSFILLLVFDRPQPWLAIMLNGFIGFNFTCFNSIPYALAIEVIDKKDAGLYMGVLNSSAVVSQTISIFTAGRIESWKNEDVAWAIAYGGIFSLLGAIVAWILPTPKSLQSSKDDENKPLLGQ